MSATDPKLSAEVDTGQAAVFLTLTGFTEQPTAAYVLRRNGIGEVTLLYDGPVTVFGGAWGGWDYESPLDVSLTYLVSDAFPATADSTVATVNVDLVPSGERSWLKHPGIPSLNQGIEIQANPELSTDKPQGVFRVLDRARPVVLTGQRWAPTFTLAVRTNTDRERRDLDALLSPGTTLLLSTPPASGLGNRYVDIGQATCTPVSDDYHEQARSWSLPCTATDRPVGAALGGPGNTWADVVRTYATWADVVAAKTSWLALVERVAPDIPPS